MKTTLDIKELKKLPSCSNSFIKTFKQAHGDNIVTLSQALDSNRWSDIWWLISVSYSEFSQNQKDDLNLLGCDWAMSCLHNFESIYPDDKRPRLAIQAKKDFINKKITKKELELAAELAESAESAAESAWSAVRSAAWAAESAESAAWAASQLAESVTWLARAASWSVAESVMKDELNELFLKWENKNE